MDYLPVTIENASEELNRLHGQIEGKLRSTVEDAIRAGEILTRVKERVGHGGFLSWIEANVRFSQPTAWRYIKINEHRDKLFSVNNLHEAEKTVAQIESEERRTESQRAADRVRHYLKTGEKLDGWRRGTDDKLVDEERARDERIEAQKAKMKQAEAERAERESKRQEERDSWAKSEDILQQAAAKHIQEASKRREFKQRIKVSQSGESDAFIDALMDYLQELDDDNRRIEACQNIIKVCRNIAADLQAQR